MRNSRHRESGIMRNGKSSPISPEQDIEHPQHSLSSQRDLIVNTSVVKYLQTPEIYQLWS